MTLPVKSFLNSDTLFHGRHLKSCFETYQIWFSFFVGHQVIISAKLF